MHVIKLYYILVLGESEDVQYQHVNEGNFRAILKYKAKDMVDFKEFLESDSRYIYTSSKIQNEIISTCGDLILEKIVKEINAAVFFNFSR